MPDVTDYAECANRIVHMITEDGLVSIEHVFNEEGREFVVTTWSSAAEELIEALLFECLDGECEKVEGLE